MNQDHSMLDAALKYHADGFSVFPVATNQKTPPMVEWKPHQTERASEEQIRQWWIDTPNANIALVTGRISNLSVIDFDGREGMESFRDHLQGELPTTRVHKTPNGSHMLFQYAPALKTTAGALPGVDIRSEGGYIIAPPSVVDGKPYILLRDRDISPLRVLPVALNGSKPPQASTTPNAPQDSPSWVTDAINNGAGQGQRNDIAARLIGYFHSRNIPKDIITALMGDFAQRCQPPMDVSELRKTIESVTQYDRLAETSAAIPHLQVTHLVDVNPATVSWLWPKRLALGKIGVVGGDPGLGKSYGSLDIAARVSVGGLWPDGGRAPKGDVVLVTAEDALDDTVRPRLDLLGADLTKIHAIGVTVRKGESEVGLSLSDHLLQIEEVITRYNAILLIIDPLLAFTGARDSNQSSQVRPVLTPLAAMAERRYCAILGVMHLNKRSGEGNAMYRLMASLDFAAAARTVMVVGKHPDDENGRVMASVKSNLSAPADSLEFHFTSEGIFVWGDVVDVDAQTLLAAPYQTSDEKSAKLEAMDFLVTILKDGAMKYADVMTQAKEAGISEKTLRRAKEELGVHPERVSFGNDGKGHWVWRIPENLQGGQTLSSVDGHLAKDGRQAGSPKLNGTAETTPVGIRGMQDSQDDQPSLIQGVGSLAEDESHGEV